MTLFNRTSKEINFRFFEVYKASQDLYWIASAAEQERRNLVINIDPVVKRVESTLFLLVCMADVFFFEKSSSMWTAS